MQNGSLPYLNLFILQEYLTYLDFVCFPRCFGLSVAYKGRFAYVNTVHAELLLYGCLGDFPTSGMLW